MYCHLNTNNFRFQEYLSLKIGSKVIKILVNNCEKKETNRRQHGFLIQMSRIKVAELPMTFKVTCERVFYDKKLSKL